jgi:LuxR family maltose regulon positive regulatory protein
MQPPGQERIKDSVSSVLHPLLDPLSEREPEVLRLIGEGHSNEEIAGALYISMGTVKTHLKHIYGKLNVHTRTQAIARGRELRILSSDPIGM